MRYKIKEFLTKQERDLLLRMPPRRTLLGLRDFCILALMLFTGLRRAEICALKRGSLKIQDKKFWLYIFGKGERWRKILIKNLELIFALQKYFKKVGTLKKEDAPMFYNFRPDDSGELQPITFETIRGIVDKYVELANIKKKIVPHSLRHTFITLTLQTGADLATVQALAGHSNISTTSRYLHTTDELMEKAIERLSV